MPAETQGKDLLQYISLGVEFILLFGLPLAAGLMLDVRLETTPGFTVLGAAIGFTIGLRRLIRQGRQIQRLGRRNRSQDQE